MTKAMTFEELKEVNGGALMDAHEETDSKFKFGYLVNWIGHTTFPGTGVVLYPGDDYCWVIFVDGVRKLADSELELT